jgi:hypothetical protein
MELNDEKLLFEGLVITTESFEPDSDSEKESREGVISDKLRSAYIRFYQETIEPKLTSIPIHIIRFDEDELELVFDLGLFEQLFDVYITEGWSGISVVEKTLIAAGNVDAVTLLRFMKGETIPLNAWNYTVLFFNFAKNMLALVIREALISMERRTSMFIFNRIMNTYGEIAKQWRKYGIRPFEKKTKSDSLMQGHNVEKIETRYTATEKPMVEDLSALLKTTLKTSQYFMQLLENLAGLKEKITAQESMEQPNYSPSSTYEEDVKKRREQLSLKDASEKLLGQLKKIMQSSHPIGLLILRMLDEDFNQSELENLLGATLDTLRKEIQALSKQLNAQTNYTALLIPFNETGDTIKDVLAFKVPKKGLEIALMELAMERFLDPGLMALLNDQTLIQLINDEIIPLDSIEYIVTYQYMMALSNKLEAIAQAQNEKTAIWHKVRATSVGLSVAALVTPPTAAAAPFLRAGVALADIALLYYTSDSVTETLKQKDVLIRNALLSHDSSSFHGLSQLGEVINLRREIFDNMENDIVMELLTIITGMKSGRVTQLLMVRSYYYDLSFLLNEALTEEE